MVTTGCFHSSLTHHGARVQKEVQAEGTRCKEKRNHATINDVQGLTHPLLKERAVHRMGKHDKATGVSSGAESLKN